MTMKLAIAILCVSAAASADPVPRSLVVHVQGL